METRFGRSYTDLPWHKRGPGSAFMKLFEGFKKDFGTSDDRSQYYDMVLVMKNVKASRYYIPEESEVRMY